MNLFLQKDVHKHGHAPEILNYQHDEASDSISQSIALIIQDLWNDKGIKKCYERRNELQLSIGKLFKLLERKFTFHHLSVDSVKYFLDNVVRITAENFSPTDKV